MQQCPEHAQDTVVFQCNEPACPYFASQKFYCFRCVTRERHNHLPEPIVQDDPQLEEWQMLKRKVASLLSQVNRFANAHGDLIRLLETGLPVGE